MNPTLYVRMVSGLKYVESHYSSPTCSQDLHGDSFAVSSDKMLSSKEYRQPPRCNFPELEDRVENVPSLDSNVLLEFEDVLMVFWLNQFGCVALQEMW